MSPDGNRIAFGRQMLTPDGNHWDVFIGVSAADGSKPRAVVTLSFDERPRAIDWSPDSRRIVFANSRGVWIVSADGMPARLIAPVRGVASVVWSPRATQIAFVRALEARQDVFTRLRDIYVVRTTGAARRRVAVAEGHTDEPVSWTADERRLVFSSKRRSRDLNALLYSVDVKTGVRRSLGPGGAPAVSPDGGRITFTLAKKPGEPPSIAVSRMNGSGRRQLRAAGFSPVWSPDGTRVAFAALRLVTMRPDGTDQRTIGPFPGEIMQLDWSR